MQVHLLDATYELFRAHFGRPPANDARGRPAAGTIGLIESVFGLLREPGVTHVACATDHVVRSWRNERYAGYKTEAGMPPELLAQFGQAEDALRAVGVVVWPMVEFEADDALAAGAARFVDAPGVERVVILSPDKDLTQCVRQDGRVVCFNRRLGQLVDVPAVIEHFGVEPASIPDYLALVGDASDGYPGLPGWGQRSAATVLRRFEHLETIPRDPAAWNLPVRGAERLAGTLAARWEEALLYRELATLRTDVPLTERVDDLRWGGVPRSAFEEMAHALDAPHLLARVPRWADEASPP